MMKIIHKLILWKTTLPYNLNLVEYSILLPTPHKLVIKDENGEKAFIEKEMFTQFKVVNASRIGYERWNCPSTGIDCMVRTSPSVENVHIIIVHKKFWSPSVCTRTYQTYIVIWLHFFLNRNSLKAEILQHIHLTKLHIYLFLIFLTWW